MDRITPAQRSITMSHIHGSDTKPERYVRAKLWAHGFRYARTEYGLPGRPDIVLPRYNTVVFVQGCFWHGHSCRKANIPESNREFWRAKIEGNRQRDGRVIRALRSLGWHCFQIWQCRLSTDTQRVIARLIALRALGQ